MLVNNGPIMVQRDGQDTSMTLTFRTTITCSNQWITFHRCLFVQHEWNCFLAGFLKARGHLVLKVHGGTALKRTEQHEISQLMICSWLTNGTGDGLETKSGELAQWGTKFLVCQVGIKVLMCWEVDFSGSTAWSCFVLKTLNWMDYIHR